MTEEERAQLKAQLLYQSGVQTGNAFFGGDTDPNVLHNMKSAQSSSFADEYEQMLQPYIGTEWEDSLRANPYLSDDYQTTQWDLLSENLGMWQSPRQKATQERIKLAREWFAKKVEEMQVTEHNSKSSQVEQSLAAGQNPDLAGLSDNAGLQNESEPSLGADVYGSAPAMSFGDAVLGLGKIATNAFQSICSMFDTFKNLRLADNQIALMGEQANLLGKQSQLADSQINLVSSNIASVDAQTEESLQNSALNWIRRTFDASDFDAALKSFADLQDSQEWDKLSYAEKVSKFINHRALSYASSSLPKSIQGRFNSLVNEFSNPNSVDFKSWLAEKRASTAEGDLRSEQSLLMLSEFGKGFGKLMMDSQKMQLKMQTELFDYQRSLYKQFKELGLPKEEAETKLQTLLTEKKTAILQRNLVTLQQNKVNTLLGIEKWLDDKPLFLKGFGQWALPQVSESLDAMIVSFGQAFGSQVGGALGNPWKNVIAPVGMAIGAMYN